MRIGSVILLMMMMVSSVLPNVQGSENTPATVDDLIANMTLEEKAGQVFMVSLYGANMTEAGRDLIMEYHPGAVALFSYNTDFQPVGEVAQLINAIQETSMMSGQGIPMIIAIDHEGGRVRRLVNDVTRFPDITFMGAVTDYDGVRSLGAAAGAELRQVGINMNLAPVTDLYAHGDLFDKNRVLYRRTFGDDPEQVGTVAAAYDDGLAESNVIGVLKHFPGHGGAPDSHLDLPIVEMDADTAYSTALRSFEIAIQEGAPAIMVGHLVYTALEPVENLPASLSPTLVTEILRGEFGFDGLVMTDALDMDAISENYGLPEASVMALNAGIDLVVLGPNVSWQTQRNSIQAVIDAVLSGELSEERLNDAVRRVLTTKAEFNILTWEPVDTETLAESIDLERSQEALFESFMDAATVVKDDNQQLPLVDDGELAIIYPVVYEDILNACREYAPDARYYGYVLFPTQSDVNAVSGLGRQFDQVVIFTEDVHKNEDQARMVNVAPPERTTVVALNSPYDLEFFPLVSTYMAMYTTHEMAQQAACHVLFGGHPAQGQLPFSVAGYPTGTGVMINGE